MPRAGQKSTKTDEGNGDRRLPPLLRRAWYGLNQAFRRRLVHLDLTPDQYTVLRNLFEAGTAGITQSEITGRMASDPNTVASLVTRMEKAGLLRREVDSADRRARRLRLATVGRHRFVAAREVAVRLQSEVLDSLPGEEQRQFLSILDTLAGACQRAAERG